MKLDHELYNSWKWSMAQNLIDNEQFAQWKLTGITMYCRLHKAILKWDTSTGGIGLD